MGPSSTSTEARSWLELNAEITGFHQGSAPSKLSQEIIMGSFSYRSVWLVRSLFILLCAAFAPPGQAQATASAADIPSDCTMRLVLPYPPGIHRRYRAPYRATTVHGLEASACRGQPAGRQRHDRHRASGAFAGQWMHRALRHYPAYPEPVAVSQGGLRSDQGFHASGPDPDGANWAGRARGSSGRQRRRPDQIDPFEPGKHSFGSTGTASTSHIYGGLFSKTAHLDAVHVAYKGAGPMLTDLLGGRISLRSSTWAR